MSISLNANFELLSAGLYLDARQQFNTLIEMKDFAETSIPDGFITYNKETQKHYVFSSSNTVDATLGKWREYNSGNSSSTTYATWNSNVDYKVGNIVLKDEVRYSCIADHTSTDFETDSINWVVVLEQYYHVTQEQYNKMVSDGLITDGTKDLYIIDGNSEGGNGGDIPLGQQVYSNTPIGTVLSFAGLTPPNGYLLCDGATYAVADYQDLYDVIGNTYGGDSTNFNVPDYRETVLIGIGENTTDTIATHDVYELGEFKDDQLQGHKHIITQEGGNASSNVSPNSHALFGGTTGSSNTNAMKETCSDGTNGTPRVGTTTHGKQKGVTYIIKAFYTNEGVDAPVELEDNVISHINNRIKDAIVTTLDDTVTDEQVASALLTKTELDKTNAKLGEKADKSYVDDNFATMDKVNYGYAKILKNRDTDTDEAMFIAYKNKELFGIRIYKNDDSEHELKFNASGISYVKNNVMMWTTTGGTTGGVANVGVTTITPVSSSITGTIKYTVKNGTCYVSFKSVQAKTNGNFSISTTMPKPDISCSIGIISDVSNYMTGCAYIDENTTQLKATFYSTNYAGSCSFSYPVAE